MEIPVGVRGLEPRTSSLSAKRSNRLSYTPVGQIREYRILPVWRNRLVVSETHEDSTGQSHAEVIKHTRNCAECSTHQNVENCDDK